MQMIPAFYFDPDRLARIAERQAEGFRTAQPFQHTVFEDFLPDDVLQTLIREFPGPDDPCWQLHGPGRTQWARDKRIAKLGTSDETRFGAFTRHFMSQLNSHTFLAFLERLSGTKGILPDPSYNHCGMHSTGPGGRLMMHTDVNRHPLGNQMHQYLNLIVYLNHDWREEYGGHLELWDDQRRLVHKYLPAANRAVLFNAGTRSLHGHPHPLTCPPDRRRNSLAVYYYLRDRPPSEDYQGMQKFVHWVAATDEDRAFGQERTQKGLAIVQQIAGTVVRVPLPLIPFDVPPDLAEADATAPLYFLRPTDWADVETFARQHVRAMVHNRGSTAKEFFAAYRPIAVLGVRQADAVATTPGITVLLDAQGEMFVVRGPDACDLFWVGYLDEILASIMKP